jgi:PAS domain S-box-containing protein
MLNRIWIFSLLPLIAGGLAMSGWWGHIPPLAQMDEKIPMLFNVAACFVMAGIALNFTTNPARLARETQIALGMLITLVAVLTFSEDLLRINLHIDELCVKCWIPDLSAHRGRMSPNTYTAFLLTGLIFIFMRFAKNKFIAACTELFIFSLFMVSALGVMGYVFDMELLYSWTSLASMTLVTAVCFLSLSLGLWQTWRMDPYSEQLYANHDDLRILLLCSAVLFSVSLTIGLVSSAKNMHVILPVSAAAIVIGLLILRWQVLSLIRRALDAEKELRRINQRLLLSEERYDLAFKGTQSGVWDWSLSDDSIFSSPYLKAMLGYAEHEMPATTEFYRQIIHPDDYEKLRSITRLHFTKNEPFNLEFRLKTKSSGYRTFSAVGQAVYNNEGHAVRMIGSMRDVTEVKKVENLKNEFMSLVRNELKLPVNSIHDALNTIQNNTDEKFTLYTQKLLRSATHNIERLSFLMKEILDVDQLESGQTKFHFKTLDITALVQEAIASNRAFAESTGTHLHLTQAVVNVGVSADHELLLQVLNNLISNAIKFTPTGGEVSIAVTKRGNFVRVSVADQGRGIPEEFQPHIFQEYVHVDSPRARDKGDVVLGLKLSKAIIEKFGGTMSFTTASLTGTTFYIDLPQTHENSGPSRNRPVRSSI